MERGRNVHGKERRDASKREERRDASWREERKRSVLSREFLPEEGR